jgi:hypothetical protein
VVQRSLSMTRYDANMAYVFTNIRSQTDDKLIEVRNYTEQFTGFFFCG